MRSGALSAEAVVAPERFVVDQECLRLGTGHGCGVQSPTISVQLWIPRHLESERRWYGDDHVVRRHRYPVGLDLDMIVALPDRPHGCVQPDGVAETI